MYMCVYLFECVFAYMYMHMFCLYVILIFNDLQGEAGQPGVPGESVRILFPKPITSIHELTGPCHHDPLFLLCFLQGTPGKDGLAGMRGEKGEMGNVGLRGLKVCVHLNVCHFD